MCGTALAFMVILETFGTQIAGLFLSAADAEVTALTAEYLHIIALFLPAFGLIMILRNSIQGMGNPWVSTLNGILESVCRIIWTIWLIRFGSFHELCYVNPTAWILAASTSWTGPFPAKEAARPALCPMQRKTGSIRIDP